jgi:hypothetical protein
MYPDIHIFKQSRNKEVRKMKVFKIFCFSFAMVLCAFTAAYAIPIVGNLSVDFRDSSWSDANNRTSKTVDNVTATALPGGSTFWQDSTDGLGVRGGTQSDEIDHSERIRVAFNGVGMNLRGVWLTDLFAYSDGSGDPLGEHGKVVIKDSNGNIIKTIDFYGNASDQANGEQFIDFGETYLVASAEFSVAGNQTNNDYSVGGFVRGTVPEPITMLLLGFGLVGLAGVRRFKK